MFIFSRERAKRFSFCFEAKKFFLQNLRFLVPTCIIRPNIHLFSLSFSLSSCLYLSSIYHLYLLFVSLGLSLSSVYPSLSYLLQ
jgi:hypothetical protein